MSSFNPAAVRKAVEEFTPLRPQKFQDLLPARDVITELRQKRASYRSIADLLTQHCLPTSKTAIAVFCHHVLGEIIRDHLGATQNQLNRIIPAYANESTEHLLNGGMVSTTPIIGELGIV